MHGLVARILAVCCIGSTLGFAGCTKKAEDPIAGAKDLVNRMAKVEDPRQLGDLMTKESAAIMGIIMMIPVAMAAGLEQLDPKAKSNPDAIGPKLDQIVKKYELNPTAPPMEELPEGVRQKGREFFNDMMSLLDTMNAKSGGKSGLTKSLAGSPKSAEDATYTVVSPTEVKIIMKNKADEQASAVFEDGQWRLSLGPFKEMMGKIQSQMKPGAGITGAAR